MQRTIHIIPRATVARLIVNAGARRVSDSGVEELADYLTKKGIEIAKKALEISKHAGRKTILEGDIKLAAKY